MSKAFLSLDRVDTGRVALVVGINAGVKATSRLEAMGILPGTQVSVLTNNLRGPMLVAVGDGRIMVERGIATKVLVA